MVGRVAELEKLIDTLSFSKERLQGQSQRISGKVRVQPHQPSQTGTPWASSQTQTNADQRGRGRTSYLDEFSELEMDRYDDFNILSRSMTEISADVNEVLSQLEGFIGRVEGDIDEFTKLAHHLQDEITAARMVPIGTLYSLLSRTVRDAAKSAKKQVESRSFRQRDGTRQQYHSTDFRSPGAPGAQFRGARDRSAQRIAPPPESRNRARSPSAPITAATTFTSKWKTTAAASITSA